jgi:hypothetical protein
MVVHVSWQGSAVMLVKKAMTASGNRMREPRQEVLDGIARVLEDLLPWGNLCPLDAGASPTPLPGGRAAAARQRRPPAEGPRLCVARRTIFPILFSAGKDVLPGCAHACWCACGQWYIQLSNTHSWLSWSSGTA